MDRIYGVRVTPSQLLLALPFAAKWEVRLMLLNVSFWHKVDPQLHAKLPIITGRGKGRSMRIYLIIINSVGTHCSLRWTT